MAFQFQSTSFEAGEAQSLEKVLRSQYPEASWGVIRRLVGTGKVSVDDRQVHEPRHEVTAGQTVRIQMTAPRPKSGLLGDPDSAQELLHVDPHVVVVRKPAGISSVEHEAEATSMQQKVHEWLCVKERRRIPPLKVVHRLDKVTSGVMMFARTSAAQADLKDQFRSHTTGRYYVAVAHGEVHDSTLHFRLVRNRGDGIRGVTFEPSLGTHSVTHVKAQQTRGPCTVVRCQLETGRTHQIRIHMAQIGHPIVGDPLYLKGYRGQELKCARTLLHAAFLSFRHPVHRTQLQFEEPVPEVFEQFLQSVEKYPERAAGSGRAPFVAGAQAPLPRGQSERAGEDRPARKSKPRRTRGGPW